MPKPYASKADYWRARRARLADRAIQRHVWPIEPRPKCPACLRPLVRVGDSLICLGPVTGPRACPRAYTD